MARSPNYPNYDLAAALKLAQKVLEKDGRNKVSRATIATHLGHESLSGPALGKIGALRAYGLLEGSGDEMRVSEDALAALRAPQGSAAQKESIARLAMKPALFQAIRREYPTKPSKESLSWWLEKQGYSGTAAAIAAKSYLTTISLVESLGSEYKSTPEENAEDAPDDDDPPARFERQSPPPPPPAGKVTLMAHERELTTGLLSKDASFRLIVTGAIGVKEIDRLIRKLELDKEILAEPDPDNVDDLV